MFYYVTNTAIYHLTSLDPETREGTTLCGRPYTPVSGSVVHEEPSPDSFRVCQRCEDLMSDG